VCFAIAVIWGFLKGSATARGAVCAWLLAVAIAWYGVLSMRNSNVYLAIAGALLVVSMWLGIRAYLQEGRETA
jgi:hypothetical protein